MAKTGEERKAKKASENQSGRKSNGVRSREASPPKKRESEGFSLLLVGEMSRTPLKGIKPNISMSRGEKMVMVGLDSSQRSFLSKSSEHSESKLSQDRSTRRSSAPMPSSVAIRRRGSDTAARSKSMSLSSHSQDSNASSNLKTFITSSSTQQWTSSNRSLKEDVLSLGSESRGDDDSVNPERVSKAKQRIHDMFLEQRKRELQARLERAKERIQERAQAEQQAKKDKEDAIGKLQEAHDFYRHQGAPDKKTLLREVRNHPNLTARDIESLPWAAGGLLVNIPAYNKLIEEASQREKGYIQQKLVGEQHDLVRGKQEEGKTIHVDSSSDARNGGTFFVTKRPSLDGRMLIAGAQQGDLGTFANPYKEGETTEKNTKQGDKAKKFFRKSKSTNSLPRLQKSVKKQSSSKSLSHVPSPEGSSRRKRSKSSTSSSTNEPVELETINTKVENKNSGSRRNLIGETQLRDSDAVGDPFKEGEKTDKNARRRDKKSLRKSESANNINSSHKSSKKPSRSKSLSSVTSGEGSSRRSSSKAKRSNSSANKSTDVPPELETIGTKLENKNSGSPSTHDGGRSLIVETQQTDSAAVGERFKEGEKSDKDTKQLDKKTLRKSISSDDVKSLHKSGKSRSKSLSKVTGGESSSRRSSSKTKSGKSSGSESTDAPLELEKINADLERRNSSSSMKNRKKSGDQENNKNSKDAKETKKEKTKKNSSAVVSKHASSSSDNTLSTTCDSAIGSSDFRFCVATRV